MDDERTMPLTPGQLFPPQPDALLNLGFRSAGTEGKSAGSDDPAALQRHLPQYRVRDIIGRGGMGNVMRVDDPKLARTVALKTMKLGPEATEEERGRFVREATVLARLAHPNIVPIYDLGADGAGGPFYTMKLVKGCTLAAILNDLGNGVPDAVKQHSLDRLLGVFRKVCDAMAFAHSKDVLHRDLKPENIMVGEFGEVLVMDWGLAKLTRSAEGGTRKEEGGAPAEHSALRVPSSEFGQTLAGSLMGTPQYMAPEQARGEVETLDARADIYALGAILYHILALRPPVEGKDAHEVLAKVARGEIEPIEQGAMASSRRARKSTAKSRRSLSISASLAAVVRKAMALDKSARYQNVADLEREIEAWQGGFATGAENAGLVKQTMLLVLRHKGLFIAFVSRVIIITLAVCFIVDVTHERNAAIGKLNRAESERKTANEERKRAETALTNLANTAPTFAALAGRLIEQGNLDDALEKIGYAVSLDARNADYAIQQANLLQATQKLAAAADGYRRVLALRADPAAKMNLELCEKLLRDNAGGGNLKRESLGELVEAMVKQGRSVEAAPLSRIVGRD